VSVTPTLLSSRLMNSDWISTGFPLPFAFVSSPLDPPCEKLR
jgi:hypothetical protein